MPFRRRYRVPRDQSLVLRAEEQQALREQAQAAFPAECCGLLLSCFDGRVQAMPMINRSPTPDRFEIAVSDLLGAHRRARQEGGAVIGHYHSHPNGLARPSAADVAAIADLAAVWVIVAVDPQTGTPGAITAWHPVERQGKAGFRPVLLLSARRILRDDPEK